MKKRTIVERRYGNVLLESYQKNTDPDSPILGTFRVEGMAAENTVSQNETYYSTQLWAMPSALGKGGTYIDENGKLRPSTLFGSLDHPLTENADEMLFRLSEAAIAWADVDRQQNGTFNGVANILRTPTGNIVNTLLEYAKRYGGGDMLGVSSRGLGESRSVNEGYNEVIPESYELLAFDFVYNPSFKNKATLTEAYKNRKPLTEAIKNLAKEDEKHADIYKQYAEYIEKEVNMNKLLEESSVEQAKKDYIIKLKEKINQLTNAIHELDMMEADEFKEKYPNKSYEKAMNKFRKEKLSLEQYLDEVQGQAQGQPDVKTEATEDRWSIGAPYNSKGKKGTIIGYDPSDNMYLVEFDTPNPDTPYESWFRKEHLIMSKKVNESKKPLKEWFGYQDLDLFDDFKDMREAAIDFIEATIKRELSQGEKEDIFLVMENFDNPEYVVELSDEVAMALFQFYRFMSKYGVAPVARVNESADLDAALEDFDEDLNEFGDEVPEDEDEENPENEEDNEDSEDEDQEDEDQEPEEIDLETVYNKLEEVLAKIEDLEMLVSPLDDFENIVDEEFPEDAEEDIADLEDLDLDFDNDEDFGLSDLTDEELEALIAEEEEYLEKNK